MPKLILNDGSEVFVDHDTLDNIIIPAHDTDMITVGNNMFRKSIISRIIEYAEPVQYHYASPLRRMIAFIIDYIVIQCVYIGLYVIVALYAYIPTGNLWESATMREQLFNNIDNINGLLMAALYFGVMFFLIGNTFGGRFTHLKILNKQGQYPSRILLTIRGLLLPVLVLGSIIIFFNQRKRTLLDMIFATTVIKD